MIVRCFSTYVLYVNKKSKQYHKNNGHGVCSVTINAKILYACNMSEEANHMKNRAKCINQSFLSVGLIKFNSM